MQRVHPDRICRARAAVRIAAQFAALLVALGGAIAQPLGEWLRDWPAPLHAALQAYRDNDLSAARRAAADVAAAGDPALRRDAAALGALVLLRGDSRADRVNGRTQLLALAEEDPALPERPECALALGIASRELGETGVALDQLDHARRGFESRGDTPRVALALVALAETWLRHGEWSATPPQFRVPRPDSTEHADQIRREQALRVLAELEALPGAAAEAHTVRLRLAEHLLPRDERAADAELAHLVEAAPWTQACAAAALLLAQRYEDSGELDAAAGLYEKAADPRWGATATAAGARLATLRQPSIVLSTPAQAPAGEPLHFELRVRGVEHVIVEARRVELETWLTQNSGRLAPATLPTSGAVVLARELDTRGGGTWSSVSLAAPLRLEAPPGAYVLSASAAGRTEPADRRLVVISDLHAAAWLGRVSATTAAPGALDADALRGLFWIHGAAAPTRLRFDAGVATFDLPADVRVRRERRWTALIRAGEHETILSGELDPGAGEPAPPQCLLTASPSHPRAGESVSVAGVVIGGATRRGETPVDQVELVDAFERRVASSRAAIAPGGVFSTVVAVPPASAGRPLRALLRRGERTIENRLGRTPVRVETADASSLRLRIEPPPWFARPDRDALLRTTLTFDVFAEYPWGTTVDLRGLAGLRTLLLPSAPDGSPARPGQSQHFHADRTQPGRLRFVTPIAGLQPEAAPLGVGFFAQLLPPDGRMQSIDAAALLGPRRAHAWLELEADQAAVGRPLTCLLAWFDPENLLRPAAAELVIAGPAAGRAEPPLHAAFEGLRSAPWQPRAAGAYVARARIPWRDPDAPPLEVECRFQVDAGADAPLAVDLDAERVQRDRQWGALVHVRARGESRPDASPILLTAFSGGEPLGAAMHSLGAAHGEVFIPFASDSAPDARLVATTLRGDQFQLIDVVPIAPPAPLALTIDPPRTSAPPGRRVRFRIVCEREGRGATNATLLARLIDAKQAGVLAWIPAPLDAPAAPLKLSATASGGRAAVLRPADEARLASALNDPPADLAAALLEGETRWVDAYAAAGAAREIEVPLPDDLERGRLIVLARTADGAVATARAEIDVVPQITLELDLPPRLSVGDRSRAAIRLHNPHADERRVRLALAPGVGLATERVRTADGAVLPRGADESWTVVVPPTDTRLLLAEIEASAAADDVFIATAMDGEATRTQRAAYEVRGLDAAPLAGAASGVDAAAAPRVKFRRTLLALTPAAPAAPPQDQTTLSGLKPSRWERYVLDERARVPTGRLLLVREEFELPASWSDVEWTQVLPPTCHTVRGQPDDVHALTADPQRRLDEYHFRLGAVPAGARVQEYFALAVRPGASRFPPPQIVVAGRPVAVEMAPDDATLTVHDAAD